MATEQRHQLATTVTTDNTTVGKPSPWVDRFLKAQQQLHEQQLNHLVQQITELIAQSMTQCVIQQATTTTTPVPQHAT